MKTLTNFLWIVANVFTLGALARRRRREHNRHTATEIVRREFARINRLRHFRRRFHFITVFKAINSHPRTRLLPRRVRRQAARNAAAASFRHERGLPTPHSKAFIRRLRRGHIPASMLMPTVTGEGVGG